MTDLLVFGADSLVGSHFVASTQHRVTAAGRRDPGSIGVRAADFRSVDLLHVTEVEQLVRESSARVVVNFAARTDVDGVEKERPATAPDRPSGDALTVNALAPEAMARGSLASNKTMITISTDSIFDGTKGPYPESAVADPLSERVSWYGWSKGEGERRVRAVDPSCTIVRITYPYGHHHPLKLDFASRLMEGYRKGTLRAMFTDQQITPTWIPDVSRTVEYLLTTPTPGVFHVASPEVTSPYQFTHELLLAIDRREPALAEGSLRTFLAAAGATPRPVRGGLACARLPKVGVRPTSWRQGIAQLASKEGRAT